MHSRNPERFCGAILFRFLQGLVYFDVILAQFVGSERSSGRKVSKRPDLAKRPVLKIGVSHGKCVRSLRQEAVVWHEREPLPRSDKASLESKYPTGASIG